jgi:hypothetical protein
MLVIQPVDLQGLVVQVEVWEDYMQVRMVQMEQLQKRKEYMH